MTTDYAKKITKAPAFTQAIRTFILGMTVVTFVGLTKLNLEVRVPLRRRPRVRRHASSPRRAAALSPPCLARAAGPGYYRGVEVPLAP